MSEKDKIVLNALWRCYKEQTIKSKKYPLMNKHGLYQSCLNSRKTHSGEKFLQNICYWPADTCLNLSMNIKLLYFALLIKNLKIDENTPDSDFLLDVFKKSMTQVLTKWYEESKEYHETIKKACEQCLNNSDDVLKAYELVIIGKENEIPF